MPWEQNRRDLPSPVPIDEIEIGEVYASKKGSCIAINKIMRHHQVLVMEYRSMNRDPVWVSSRSLYRRMRPDEVSWRVTQLEPEVQPAVTQTMRVRGIKGSPLEDW